MAAQIAEAQKLVTGEAEADPIARLYAAFEVCANCDPSNVDEASKAAYGTILASASHSADGVRQLVTGFIPRFFHLFPGQAQTALNAQLDLVEDDEASIRLAAIPGLVELCRRSSEPVQTVASVLGQLLLSEDQTELKTVQESLRKLFDLHQSSAFSALFQQIRVSEGAQRGKSIDCIARQLRLRADQVKADEALQQHVADETKAVLKHESVADVKEFRSLLRIVRRLPIFSKNPRIARSVVATIAEKAGLKSGAPVLDARDADVVARASQYVDMAVGLFKQRYRAQPPVEASAGVPAQAAVEPPNAGPMFAFFVSDVMPALEAADVPDKHKVVLFQNAATLLQFCPSDVAIAAFEPIAAKFLASLPSGDGAAATNFGIMEPLLAMIHTLSRGNLRGAKYQLGLFVKTGQPSDFRADLVDKKERVVNGLQALLQELETYVQRVRVVLTKFKTQQRELINAKKAASKTTAAAAAAAVAGVAEAVPDAPAKSGKEEADEDGDDEEEEATGAAAAAAKAAATADPLKVLREKMASLKVALRRADAIRAMCPPLMKDAPNFMDVDGVRLSWGKQQQQQQQKKKKKQQQGQKKKGGSAQAAANAAAGAQKGGRKNQKKRGAQQQQQGGGQRKRRKGQQQGQQQQQQGKKKKNGGGQQQKQGGGRRRRGRN